MEQSSKNIKNTSSENTNSQKKARQFDFDLLFAQTIESKQTEQESADFSRISLQGGVDEITKIDRNVAGNKQEDDFVGPPIPENLKNSKQDDGDEDVVGPPLPSGFILDKNVLIENADDAGFDEDEINVSSVIPASYEVSVKTDTTKAITALAFDLQGAKFAIGTYSYSVILSRQIYPCESHVLNDLAFSNNAENLLVGSSSPILRLLDRQGSQWAETVRGDQYLVDPANTKGHTAAINSVCWHPLIYTPKFHLFLFFRTLRIWDINDYKDVTKCINTQRKLIKTKNSTGKRALATTCCYSRDG
uniref:Uncharacterized protein n=1 Tax=Meloidogyne incognita TaxID=6306 RepID=A0A914NU62_MELIC